jgi:cell division septation protein DedD
VLGRDGDRARVQVINKYGDEVVAKIPVPVDATALRMDPLGRYVLVRHAGTLDSVLVIGIATGSVLGGFASPWRADLPLVFPDGRLATLRGNDVVVLADGDFRPVTVVPGGAKDIWTVVQWNGFRRRAGDAPLRASAPLADTVAVRPSADSAIPRVAGDSSPRDSVAGAPRVPGRLPSEQEEARSKVVPGPDSQARPRPTSDGSRALGDRGTFVVQFAALKAEQPAQELAASIKSNGEKAHVISTMTNGIALYRVILGPFRSRADAERAGQAAGRDYWVFEGGSN